MAARMKSEGGSPGVARAMYQQIYQSATDEQTKELAIRRLQQIESNDEMNAIRAALQRFQATNNRCAVNWREMFPLLQTAQTTSGNKLRFAANFQPLDPSETAYELNNQSGACTVALNAQLTKIALN